MRSVARGARLGGARIAGHGHRGRAARGAAAAGTLRWTGGRRWSAVAGGEPSRDFEALIERRRDREPVSQILGQWEFWSLPFYVTAATLTPRPDTETLVQAALDLLPDRKATLRLLDLGTGSGCLLLALLHELPAARGLGIDRSPAALAVAERNASALGLADRAQFALGDWAEGLSGRFDLIVSNPPYIPRHEIPGLMPEVSRHEPRDRSRWR